MKYKRNSNLHQKPPWRWISRRTAVTQSSAGSPGGEAKVSSSLCRRSFSSLSPVRCPFWQSPCLSPHSPHLSPGSDLQTQMRERGQGLSAAVVGRWQGRSRTCRTLAVPEQLPSAWCGAATEASPRWGFTAFLLLKAVSFVLNWCRTQWGSWHLPAPSSSPAGKCSSLQEKTCGQTTWITWGSVACPAAAPSLPCPPPCSLSSAPTTVGRAQPQGTDLCPSQLPE